MTDNQQSQSPVFAAIDVGSNAARLLIKQLQTESDGKQRLRKLLFLRVPLRLGMEVFTDGKLSWEKADQFIHTMKAYRQLMKVYGVEHYRACATSAMRDSGNGKKVMKAIEKEAHIKLEIISGDEESQIVYDNHLSLLPTDGNFLYVDVGGGSTECTFIHNGERIHSHSYNVGTIRLLKGKVSPEAKEEMQVELQKVSQGYDNITIVGSGGNINKLYRLAAKREKSADSLPVATLRKLHEALAPLTVEERMDAFNLKPDRADVIVPAAEIFLAVAESTESTLIQVPNLGLADGIINEMVQDYQSQAAFANSTVD